MNYLTTNSSSVTIGDFRKRIFAFMLIEGMFFTKMHAGSTRYKGKQIYQCIRNIKDGPYTIIFAKPISGRSQDVKIFSGERYVYVKRNK